MPKSIQLTEDDIALFWSYVDKRGEGECWNWKKSKNTYGYGKFSLDGDDYHAHRVAWQIANGRAPHPGYQIAHAPIVCHNRACCNPAHLSEKTQKENESDKRLDGTVASGTRNGKYTHPESALRGERNPSAKLTQADVHKIRELRKQGVVRRSIMEMFGIGASQIGRISRGENWK
jgi:hypothetical protein